jgi:hypothetical protein
MKRRWIALGFLVVAVALGAWLIFSGKPAGRVSIRFLGYHTNEANECYVEFSITNGYDFPVWCLLPVTKNNPGTVVIVEAQKAIDPQSALSHRVLPKQLTQIAPGTGRLEVEAWRIRPFTRTVTMRQELSDWLLARKWKSLSRFVEPARPDTVLSEPIVFPPEARQD